MTWEQKVRMGMRLRDVRIQRGISVSELARAAGLSAAHLCNIERAIRQASLDTAVNLAQMLNVSLDYIVLGVRPERNSWKGLVLRSDDELLRVVVKI